ncbi:MAG: membrane protein insertase YidC [Bacteroidetes bacterium]|nr:MAG: membrane protein insertase YidC [Bacteroidota bacterium]
MLNQNDNNSVSSITGIVLIFVILIGYSLYTQPSEEELRSAQEQRDSIAVVESEIEQRARQESSQERNTASSLSPAGESTVETNLVNQGADSARLVDLQNQYGSFASSSSGEEKLYVMENERMRVTVSSLGGRVSAVELKGFRTYDSLPLYLFKGDSSLFSLNFFADNKSISTKDLYFTTNGASFIVEGNSSNTLSMRLYAGEDKYIEFQYTLAGNSNEVGFNINFHNMQNTIAANANYLTMDWSAYVPKQEKSLKNERINSTIYYRFMDDEVDYLSETSDESEALATKIKWVAFKQQFFTTYLSAVSNFEKPTYVETFTDEESNAYVKRFAANFTIPYNHMSSESFPMEFYFGPNNYNVLKEHGQDFEKVIPLGWGIFGWVNKGLIIPIFDFLGKYIDSYGIIILLMTIFIKIILFPLMYKSYQSTAKMRVLKPEIDEIGEKYPKQEDNMKKQQAVMAMYKKTGVNPLGGCLPMVVQMPILIAMYRFFPSSIELRQKAFLWADDLSAYDSIYDFPNDFSIPFYGDHISLFTLLMTGATLLSVKMNSEMTGGSQMQMPQMKMMMYIMPIMFLGFFNDFASALSYYYFIATMITFGQQWAMRKFVDEDAIRAKINEHQKKPAPKKSSFQKRLEKMAKDRGYKG